MKFQEFEPHNDRFFAALERFAKSQQKQLSVFHMKSDEYLVEILPDQISFTVFTISRGDESMSVPGFGLLAEDAQQEAVIGFIAQALHLSPEKLRECMKQEMLPAGIIGGPFALAVVQQFLL